MMSLYPVLKPDPNKLGEAYELVDDLKWGHGKIPAGFQFDGASIPKLAWPAIGTPFSPSFMGASIVHDWLYHTHQFDKDLVDEIFHKLLLEDGVNGFKAGIMYEAVKHFGNPYWPNDAEDLAYMERLRQRILKVGGMPKDYGL